MKTCSKCGLKKSLTAFHRRTAAKDGLTRQCKACTTQYNKAYYRKNETAICARGTRYYMQHSKKVRARHARRRKEHPEQIRAREARYSETHREERSAAACRWSKANPELHRAKSRLRRARKHDVFEHFTPELELFVKAFWGNKCAFCDKTKKLQVDHWRPLSKGYALTVGNAVLLCKTCNSSKRDKLPEELNNQVLRAAIEQRLLEQAQLWSVRQVMPECFAAHELLLA